MLQTVCDNICNRFIQKRLGGHYEIANGMISPLSLKDGQRFLIQGSALNDGMYTYHPTGITNDDDTEAVGLHDESWDGTICALAVPPAVVALSAEIKAWVDAYGDSLKSPYKSESVLGVYSYTKESGTGAGGTVGWQDVFADRLKQYRKVNLS